ncbi:MAG: hypothetical protein Kow00124_32110 [Anaerolineae bacterium]
MSDITSLLVEKRPSGLLVIRVSGDLDSLGTHMVEEDFNRAVAGQSARVLVDLSGVRFISSAGMAMLLVSGKTLRQNGGSLLLTGANARVMEVLAMTGINQMFDFYPTLAEALDALERS